MNTQSEQRTDDAEWEAAGAVPPPNWPEYEYTPEVGHLVKRPNWGHDVTFTVVEVGWTGLRATAPGSDKPLFFARRPDGELRSWVRVG